MTDLRQAAQQALEALRGYRREIDCHQPCDAERGLEAALEQPEQEPVAWADREELARIKDFDATIYANEDFDGAVPLYTHPPRRKWYGLKEWEINDGRDQLPTEDLCNWSFRKGAYFAEAKLKEKNA